MNPTSRMAALLGELRRERNGAVADTMHCYGKPYGLNYGVSLPTVRQLARTQAPDADFARYLWQQDVRELRLVALHVAQPECLTPAEFGFWGAGIVNSELAEEAAFAFLGRAGKLPELFDLWIAAENPLLQYTALMAASRCEEPDPEWIAPAVKAVRLRAAAEASGVENQAPFAAHLIALGAVALLAAVGSRIEENRQTVLRAAGSLGKLPSEDFVHEELAWRL